MQFPILSAVIEELAGLLPGSRVARVYERKQKELIITIRARGKDFFLLIAPDRSLPRLHLVSKKPEAVCSLHPFSLYLRSRMSGGRITGINIVNRDRVVELQWSRHGAAHSLIIELIGSAANLIVLDGTRVIRAVYYPGKGRRVTPGTAYVPPEKNVRSPVPTNNDQRWLVSTGDRQEPPNRAAEVFYNHGMEQKQVQSFRTALRRVLKRARAKTAKKVEVLGRELGIAKTAEQYKQAGDLILASRNELVPGMKQAELAYPECGKILVFLDPALSPAENAALYFKRYRKARAGQAMIPEWLRSTRQEMSFLRGLQDMLEESDDRETMSMIRARLGEKGYLPDDGGKKRQIRSAGHAGISRIVHKGWEIVIGMNAAGNDHVTTRIARDRDLWLHADGHPGSHVLIINPEGRNIPGDVLEKAASLAAFHSKGRLERKVPVAYTTARFVKKPKGAKAGLVTLSERKTIIAVPRAGEKG